MSIGTVVVVVEVVGMVVTPTDSALGQEPVDEMVYLLPPSTDTS